MSERMTPIPFKQLMNWLLTEHKKQGSVFGVKEPYIKKDAKTLSLFGAPLETPFGPAAGPNTQLAQNIIASYYAGARFFELKTVQKMDGEELAACIGRPCILASDEGYNCEWSTELTVPQAFDEYVKAWVALKMIAKLWGLGAPDGFQFNMSVGYDLAGIKTEKLDRFIEGMKNASNTAVFKECLAECKRLFPAEANYIDAIDPRVCTGVTVSTLHGCPPQEIESIATYLILEKGLNTFVKCNPTILGYEFARERLDALGYDYVAFDRHHFDEDLQYRDAVPMFSRLSALALTKGLTFGLKLSNTFPVDVKRGELPSNEMYMSGRALYPLTIEMANRFAREFNGKLRLSFSGGADAFNVMALFDAGIWPITVATTILKVGGYARLTQLARELETRPFGAFTGVNAEAVAKLSADSVHDAHFKKPLKPLPSRKLETKVPLLDCFVAPCEGGCPIRQDIPEYIELCGKGLFSDALEVILEKNPLPFITGTICPHRCTDKCTRHFYEEHVLIRETKLIAAENGLRDHLATLRVPRKSSKIKIAVIGGGPAGLAAAYFIARAGYAATVFEKEKELGGLVRHVIPEFRIAKQNIDNDVRLIERMGVQFELGKEAPQKDELVSMGYTHILLAVGAYEPGKLGLDGGSLNVIDFLRDAKSAPSRLHLGENVAVIGGGNSAMDAARAAKRLPGVKRVSLVYRRTKKYMPADEEELELAMADGVEFCELLAPVKRDGSMLVCHKMRLGAPDQSGRRSPVDTGELATIPADTVISAVGEHVDEAFLRSYGVEFENGKPKRATNNIFVAGDALRGPATVVEAIADATACIEAILGEAHSYGLPESGYPPYGEALDKKPYLRMPTGCEADRCLACNTVCENCATVCPNRANLAIRVNGRKMRQILHVDYMCNECGNCTAFCPHASDPYKEKLTLFANERDFLDSDNPGFYVTGKNAVRLRLSGGVQDVDLSRPNSLEKGLEAFILTVLNDYAYLLPANA
ncbi:MAG: putative selenate reductase subunit YgfK [Clostridiaceae bacterium]|nr:putative selenate reductase subunit YgfK [Eubacteriales bacterium]